MSASTPDWQRVLRGARRDYRQALSGDAWRSSADAVADATESRRLTWLGSPLCDVLRPYWIPAPALRAARRASTLIVRGLNTAVDLLARDPALRASLGLTALQEAAVRCDRGESTELVGRLDGFLGPDLTARFIEYNPDPGAVGNYLALSRLFARLPAVRAFARRHRVRPTFTLAPLAPLALRWSARAAARGGVTVVQPAPDTPDALSGQLDQEIDAYRSGLRRLGLRFEVARPEALDFHRGRVTHGGRRVGCVYVTDWEALHARLPPPHPFWDALASGALWALNSWAAQTLRANKATFALLSDDAHAAHFAPEVVRALRAHLPWTRVLRDGPVEHAGRRFDLLTFAETRREDLVLKPTCAQGGKGVVLGHASTAAQWQAALQAALATPHVLQTRVLGRREPFPRVRCARLEWRAYALDFNVFVWDGRRVHGYMARASRGALMNVTSGSGSLVPVFALERD